MSFHFVFAYKFTLLYFTLLIRLTWYASRSELVRVVSLITLAQLVDTGRVRHVIATETALDCRRTVGANQLRCAYSQIHSHNQVKSSQVNAVDRRRLR